MRKNIEKYKGKHCEVCGTPSEITRDHIVPKWLERRFEYFQFEVYMVNNDQYLCKTHNQNKGGVIDYTDERVRRFLKRFIQMIQHKIDVAERDVRNERTKEMVEERKSEIEKNKSKPVNGLTEPKIL